MDVGSLDLPEQNFAIEVTDKNILAIASKSGHLELLANPPDGCGGVVFGNDTVLFATMRLKHAFKKLNVCGRVISCDFLPSAINIVKSYGLVE